MSGKKSKQRGKGFEYRVRDWFRKAGFKADRVPVSGVSHVMKGDVVVELEDRKLFYELKYRERGLDGLYKWIDAVRRENCEALIVGSVRKKPLVVMELDRYLEMLKKLSEGGGGGGGFSSADKS